MQILLNIPDKYVSLDKSFQEMILEMKADGVRGIATILSKGHGELIDRSEVIKSLFDYHNVKKTIGQCIDDVPTIIEADKEEDQ